MYYFYFVTRPIFVFIWNRIYKKIVREKNKSLALTFISTFRYIDEVLSINNCYVHINIYSINPSEIMIIDIIDLKSTTSVLYFDTLLERDIECNLTIELYDDNMVMTSIFLYSTFLTYVAKYLHHLHIELLFLN